MIVLYFPLVAVPASLVAAVPVWQWPSALWTLTGSLLVLGGTMVAARRPRLPA